MIATFVIGFAFAAQSIATPATPSLTCGKYQHIDHWPSQCGPVPCDEKTGICLGICGPVPPDKCVDDIHVITEKEWQNLLERLQTLDGQNSEHKAEPVKSFAHRGHVQRSKPVDAYADIVDFAMIAVKSCEINDGDRHWLPLYADEKLTTALPNPIATDQFGAYTYYTTTPYAVTILEEVGGKELITETCPTNNK
jgi:hypothetical protein